MCGARERLFLQLLVPFCLSLLSFHGVLVDSHAREIRDALALAMGRPLRKCSSLAGTGRSTTTVD